MREIKFRAFYEGKIYQVGDIRFEAKEVCLWNRKGTEFNFIDTSKVALMQFTGLHDKNGTEIYEGDILSDYTETDEGVVKSFQRVYWCEKKGAWMLDESYHQNKSESRLLSKNLEQFDYEISANIYIGTELIN